MSKEKKNVDLFDLGKPDWFLKLLVDFANDGLIISITLQVGGLLVSGDMIGGKTYFDAFSDLLLKGIKDKEGKSVKLAHATFEKLGKLYEYKDYKKIDLFIHLDNARFFHPGGRPIPSHSEALWRGKIEAVDGYILGKLTT